MSDQKQSFWMTPQGFAAMGLIASVSYFLLVEHRQHVFEFLPYLILLLCPLMHFFMHRGHGGHNDHSRQKDDDNHHHNHHSHKGD